MPWIWRCQQRSNQKTLLTIPVRQATHRCGRRHHLEQAPPVLDAGGMSATRGRHWAQNQMRSHDLGNEHPRKQPIRAPMSWRRSEEHTSELQSLMRISYAVFCLKKKKKNHTRNKEH